jgi:hypothetical protein
LDNDLESESLELRRTGRVALRRILKQLFGGWNESGIGSGYCPVTGLLSKSLTHITQVS